MDNPVEMENNISYDTNDLPEEIVVEILSRLPIRPLFRFKCISKLWNSTINNPNFRRNYLQRTRSSSHRSGMLYPIVKSRLHDDIDDDAVTLDAPPALYVTALSRPPDSYDIMASSNGLILSCLTPQVFPASDPDEYEWEHQLSVSNPITKQSARLRMLWISVSPWGYGLATRPGGEAENNQDYLTYRVVFIQIMKDRPHPANTTNFGTIDIFSSDTARWTRKEHITCPPALLSGTVGRAISYEGILHWFEWNTRTLVTYDPYDSPDNFGSIPMPSGSGEKVMNSGVNLIRLGHEELLEFGEIEECGEGDWRLCVWRLVDYDKGEWRVEKRCPISPLWEESPETLLRDCRLLVAPDPLKDELFCWLFANKDKIAIRDLASTEEVFVAPFEVTIKADYFLPGLVGSLVPIALNPWTSPFHGPSWYYPLYGPVRINNSSSEPGFGEIIPAWFPSA